MRDAKENREKKIAARVHAAMFFFSRGLFTVSLDGLSGLGGLSERGTTRSLREGYERARINKFCFAVQSKRAINWPAISQSQRIASYVTVI